MLDQGYKTGDLRQLEKKHPGQLDKTPEYLKVKGAVSRPGPGREHRLLFRREAAGRGVPGAG